MDTMQNVILKIKDLCVKFYTDDGIIPAVRNVSFEIPQQKIITILGESGSGKSVTAKAIMNLIVSPGSIERGSILLRDKNDKSKWLDILRLKTNSKAIRSIRWADISMVFQDPMNSFTPVYTVGNQICEAIMLHRNMTRQQAKSMAMEYMEKVAMPDPARVFDSYPHQLSGGMSQRAMIAMALCCQPRIIIADEPTTALDATVQIQLLHLLKKTVNQFNTAVLLITHNLGIVAEVADEVIVMYLGKIIEKASVEDIFDRPMHPYTAELFASIPTPQSSADKPLRCIPGTVPNHLNIPKGCPFFGRCNEQMAICKDVMPTFEKVDGANHYCACWLYEMRKNK